MVLRHDGISFSPFKIMTLVNCILHSNCVWQSNILASIPVASHVCNCARRNWHCQLPTGTSLKVWVSHKALSASCKTKPIKAERGCTFSFLKSPLTTRTKTQFLLACPKVNCKLTLSPLVPPSSFKSQVHSTVSTLRGGKMDALTDIGSITHIKSSTNICKTPASLTMIWSEYYYRIFSLNTKVHLTITLNCTFKVRYFCCYLDIGSKETSTQKSASITQVFAGQKSKYSSTRYLLLVKICSIFWSLTTLTFCFMNRTGCQGSPNKYKLTVVFLLQNWWSLQEKKKSCMKDLLTTTLQVPKHTRDNPLLQLHSLKSLLSSFSTLSVQRCF